MRRNSIFIPHTPDPFDAWHKFTKDDAMDDIVSLILGDDSEGPSVLLNWSQYFENHLKLPIEAMVECPIKGLSNNAVSTTNLKMTIVSLAPIEKCPIPFLVFIAKLDKNDAGRYIFADDIRKFLNNLDAEQIFMPYIYWLYFEKNKKLKGR
jgi:hypothetical protein